MIIRFSKDWQVMPRINWLNGKRPLGGVGYSVFVDMRDPLASRWMRLYGQRRRSGRQRPSVLALKRWLRGVHEGSPMFDLIETPSAGRVERSK